MTIDSAERRGRRHLANAWLILLAGLVGSLLAWSVTASLQQRASDASFRGEAADIGQAIRARIAGYLGLVRGFDGLVDPQHMISRAAFHRYATSLDLTAQYPGVIALQFARQIAAADKAAFEAAVRADTSLEPRGYPDYAIHPPGVREAYMPVLFNEPMAGNESAFGHDQIHDPVRRETMERARDSGRAAASPPIRLVQASGAAGIVLRQPIYSISPSPASLAARRSAYIGQISLVIRTDAMLRPVISPRVSLGLHVSLKDPAAGEPQATLLDSASFGPAALALPGAAGAADRIEDTIEIGGRSWQLVTTRAPLHVWAQPLPLVILGGGLVTSLLLFALFRNLALRHGSALAMAEELSRSAREREAQLRAVFDGAHEAIITIDRRAVIQSVNPATSRLFGYPAGEMIGRNVAMLMPEPDRGRHDGYVERYLATGQRRIIGIGREVSGLRKDGSTFPLELSVTETQGGVERQFIGILRDVSDRKRAAAAMRELNEGLEHAVAQRTLELTSANRELEYFAYTVAHDLRAPARHITGYATMLAEDLGERLSAGQAAMVRTIVDGAQRQGRLLDELLAYTRLGAHTAQLAAVDLSALIGELQAELVASSAHAAAIDWRIDALPPVIGDPTLLRQAFVNLLDNAVKFTREAATPRIAVSAQRGEPAKVTISVADNGAGFDMRYADKLFRIFQRLHTEREFPGTGIGLAIVRRAIDKHGGELHAEGRPGHGATFRITLTLAEPTP